VAPKIIEKILRSGRNPAEPESVVESAWYLAGAVAERLHQRRPRQLAGSIPAALTEGRFYNLMTTKVIISLSVSQDVANWLAEKKKNNSANISSLVNSIIEERMIKEMEESLNENS
jgi:hypothetical protein